MDLLEITMTVLRFSLAYMRGFRNQLKVSFAYLKEKPHPSRLFKVPPLSRVEKVHLVLASMQYEIIEQSQANKSFHLVALLENSQGHPFKEFQNFPSVQIAIEGVLLENQKWEIRLSFMTLSYLSPRRTKDAELVLDEITRALGWQGYLVVPQDETSNILAA
jgi:hypothetical protein